WGGAPPACRFAPAPPLLAPRRQGGWADVGQGTVVGLPGGKPFSPAGGRPQAAPVAGSYRTPKEHTIMPRSLDPAAHGGRGPVRGPSRWRPAWALAALLAALVAAPHAPAQNGAEKPQLIFSPDPTGQVGRVRELRLRPHVQTAMFLFVLNEAAPAG